MFGYKHDSRPPTNREDIIRITHEHAEELLVDWVKNLPIDEMAKLVSKYALNEVQQRNGKTIVQVFFDPMLSNNESHPYEHGRKLTMPDSDPTMC